MSSDNKTGTDNDAVEKSQPESAGRLEPSSGQDKQVRETGGPAGPEPTRYGDWEKKGRCIDF